MDRPLMGCLERPTLGSHRGRGAGVSPHRWAICLLLFLYGLVIDLNGHANFVPLNTADSHLHLGLAVAMIVLGVLLARVGAGRRTGPVTATADPRR